MKNFVGFSMGLLLLFGALGTSHARDEKYLLPIKAAMESTDARERPDGSVKFFFAKEQTPQVLALLGNDVVHTKTGTRPANDAKSCNAAFLLALVDLQKRAKKRSANAVVNIVSYYKKVEMSSATEFECHAGAAAHVFLKGNFAKIAAE
jgi:hypothetical protein